MKKRNYKEYQYTSFWQEEDDDILFWNYTPGLEMDIKVANNLVESRLDYTQGKATYVLVDATNLKSSTKEARQFMSNPSGGLKGILAGAFVSTKTVTIVLINLFLKINRPSVPARFFNNKEDAIQWIKRIKQEKEILSRNS